MEGRGVWVELSGLEAEGKMIRGWDQTFSGSVVEMLRGFPGGKLCSVLMLSSGLDASQDRLKERISGKK